MPFIGLLNRQVSLSSHRTVALACFKHADIGIWRVVLSVPFFKDLELGLKALGLRAFMQEPVRIVLQALVFLSASKCHLVSDRFLMGQRGKVKALFV